MEIERALPMSIEAERACLGAILLDNVTWSQAAERLTAEDFGYDSHRRIYLRMEELANVFRPIDFVTLTDQLGMHREIEAVGGVAYVTSLTDGLPRVKNIEQYVRIIEDKAMLRSAIHACNGTINACYEQDAPARTIIGIHDEAIQKIMAGGEVGAQHVSEFSSEVLAEIRILSAKEGIVGFSYGVPEVDAYTSGLQPGELVVIGGRPKDGKTAFALSVIEANCKAGIPVGFASIEMAKEKVLKRIYSSVGRIDATRLKQPNLMEDEDWRNLEKAQKSVDMWPFYVDEDADITISRLCAKARLWQRKFGIKIFVVDYLQLIEGLGRDLRIGVAKITRGLRILAKETGLAVLALSQLVRPEGRKMNIRPTMFDLKESGTIEADANVIGLLFRPIFVGGEEENVEGRRNGKHTGEDELAIVQRDGDWAIARLTYVGKWVKFFDRDLRGYFGFTS